ncbi:DUF1513 domain-containing protein [Vibrio sp. WJH972]
MLPMVTDRSRRTLLKAALLGSSLPLLPLGCASTAIQKRSALIGCSYSSRSDYRVVVASLDGKMQRELPLPGRGHGIAIHPTQSHAVAFSRRPGQYMLVFDYLTGETIKLQLATKDRHYYGHGVYSLNGALLYVTEGESATSQGIIGVYSVDQGYKKVAEFTEFGIGPHEIVIKNNGQLVVGVGGVQTQNRKPTNLDSMSPSLAYLSDEGELLDQVRLGDHHLSIRHLAHDGAETILCGQQYRGEPDNYPALVAMHRPGQAMVELNAEPEQWARFNHYIASIAANNDYIVATSPPGNCYGIWDKHSGDLVELASLPDASGVVVANEAFYISSGSAKIVESHFPASPIIHSGSIQWDNHWSSIPSQPNSFLS